MYSIDQYKKQAKVLREFLAVGGIEIKHTHALEAVARMHGAKDFHLLSHAAGQPPSYEQYRDAARLLMDTGVSMEIAYWNQYMDQFWLDTPEKVAEYAVDPTAFVTALKSKDFAEVRERILQKYKGLPLDDKFLHFLRFREPNKFNRYRGCLAPDDPENEKVIADDPANRCVHRDADGTRCENVFFFDGEFADFVSGVHDHCPDHRPEEMKDSFILGWDPERERALRKLRQKTRRAASSAT
jgi:hypothetical protein